MKSTGPEMDALGHYSVVVTERYTHFRPDLFADCC
jgi:hypothetical protein